jgi:hypothetical protein
METQKCVCHAPQADATVAGKHVIAAERASSLE